LLLLIVQNRIKKLKDKLLLFTRQQFDLLELSLKLRSRTRLAFRGVRFASQKFGNGNFLSGGGAFDEIECRIFLCLKFKKGKTVDYNCRLSRCRKNYQKKRRKFYLFSI